ncbi:MAG: peptidoglycan editing factor PgeF [Proteobacteria bacterium]|nr:peptidoglycan editing factor PgeF [Pseudomonadota bacterium]
MQSVDSIRLVRSHLIDPVIFLHGFPERTGGISKGARRSLNLGYRWGDERASVEQNRRLLAAFAGFDYEKLAVTNHVHGTAVWRVGEDLPDPPEFDGLVSDRPGAVVGAFAADCIPLLFADPSARVCGAAHAGWRGTVAGVAARVIARMGELGSQPSAVRVALGPSIGPCCFEVGPEVVTAFRDRFGDLTGLVVSGPRKDHIDLRVASRTILEDAGVLPEHIDDTPPCTKCRPDRFFSYRRDGRDGGVHMGFIGLRPLDGDHR